MAEGITRYCGAFATSIAFHGLIAAALAWSTFVPLPRTPRSARPVQVVLLPPNEDRTFRGLQPVDRSDPGWKVGAFPEGSKVADADLNRIAVQVAVLFPFVTPGLALDAFFPSAASPSHLTFESPFARRPTEPRAGSGRPLNMSAEALQSIVDDSWSRGHRWDAFAPIRAIIATHNADDERLATLVRLYREQNALQPYADGAIRDLRLWAQLALAADHLHFIGFVRDYAAAHPSTRTTTELLMLLDTIAQANEDALATLVETDQPGDLTWTRMAHPRAYELARQIQHQYARVLTANRLTSRSAIGTFYANGRLALLLRIMATTPAGYRVNDLRYLIGEIQWNQGHLEEAYAAWRQLTPASEGVYAAAIAALREAVKAPRPDARTIGFIVRNQQGRWLAFSDDRLRRFGYRIDTF